MPAERYALVAHLPVEHDAVDRAAHGAALLFLQNLLQLGFGLGFFLFENVAGELLASDVLQDHFRGEIRGGADGHHRRVNQLVLLVVHVALHLGKLGLLQLLFRLGMRHRKLSNAVQLPLRIVELGFARDHALGSGLDGGLHRQHELLGLLVGGLLDLDVGVFGDARVETLHVRTGSIGGELQVARDNLSHDLSFLDGIAFVQVDRLDPPGDRHGNEVRFRQAGLCLLVDERGDRADLHPRRLNGHSRSRSDREEIG